MEFLRKEECVDGCRIGGWTAWRETCDDVGCMIGIAGIYLEMMLIEVKEGGAVHKMAVDGYFQRDLWSIRCDLNPSVCGLRCTRTVVRTEDRW